MSDDVDPLVESLRARMVAGELPRVRLELMDELGHRPSRYALGRKDPEPAGPWDHPPAEPTLEAWGRKLGRFGGAIMLRVGAALIRHLLAEHELPGEVEVQLGQALAAADRFLGNPAPEGPELEQAATLAARATLGLDLDSPQRRVGLALLPLLRAMLDVQREGSPDQEQLKAHYLRLLEQAGALQLALEPIQVAVRAELATWALS